ncbi:MAG TPA: glycosyltransferase, partial [Desulfobacteraceae bacterium]|nr:glycosyltransferase [Desulfobacteraceae bacterium]
MESKRKIFILMGTYNGSPFLAEQLQSIQNQDLRDWTLLVRDDGSKDDTCNIVADFTKKDNRIVYISDDNKHLGVIGNYGRLMRAAMDSGAETIFFSDQDDVWLPYKMSRQIRHMAEFERLYGRDTPVLIHSDLKVVDKRLNTISDSFMVYQGIANESKSPLKILLAQNFVTGCATVINRPLLEIALPIPENVMMHD